MSVEENNGGGQQRDVAEINFAALQSDELFAGDFNNPPANKNDQSTEDKNKEGDDSQKGTDGQGGDESKNQEAELAAANALKEEAKALGLPETATKEEIDAKKAETQNSDKKTGTDGGDDKGGEQKPFELKAEDIEGFEEDPAEGTWKAVAKAQGLKIEEDTYEAYDAAIKQKYESEIEKAKSTSLETVLAGVKPETAAALKLIEMGMPEEMVFAPTKQIDSYLGMEDAELVREDLKLQGWKQESIDMELETLVEKGRLGHEAEKLRLSLNQQKEQIVQQRESLLQQYTENKQKVELQQKQERAVQFQKALDTVSSFMNVPLSQSAKSVIAEKYSRGDYANDLSDVKSDINYLLFKEFGEKTMKHIENTAYQRGRDEYAKHLLNVPPVNTTTANSQQINQKEINNWAAIENDFGENK